MRFFLILLSCCASSALAQPALTAELSRNLTGDEYYTIRYTVEGASKVSSFIPPSFKGLTLLKGPEQTQGYSLQHGELMPYVSFNYIVKPATTGRIILDGAVAVADGKTLRSRTVEIFASVAPLKDAARSSTGELEGYLLRKGEKVEDKMKGNLFVKLSLSRKACYVGEPIVAEYDLYTRLNSESRVVKRPSFNGFSTFDMAPQESGAVLRRTYNGKAFDVYPLRKVMMYPLQAGTLALEALEVENVVSFVDPDQLGNVSLADALRAYGDGKAPAGSVVKQKVVVSNPVQAVQVKPLPESGKPAGFTGAVGRFAISATLDHHEVEQGVVSYLDVTVTGQGNLPVLGKPAVQFPEAVEAFEDSIRAEYDQSRDPGRWKKTFTVPFTVRKAGDVVIPPIKLVYFDPDSGHYRTSFSAPLSLRVKPASGADKIEQKPVSFWNAQTDRYWIWLPVLLALGILILFTVQRVRDAGKRRAREAAWRGSAKEARSEAFSQAAAPKPFVALELDALRPFVDAGDAQAFHRSTEGVLRQWCRVNLGSDPMAGKEECERAWSSSGRSAALWNELLGRLKNAESARFDPLQDTTGLADVLAQLEDLNRRLAGDEVQSVNL